MLRADFLTPVLLRRLRQRHPEVFDTEHRRSCPLIPSPEGSDLWLRRSGRTAVEGEAGASHRSRLSEAGMTECVEDAVTERGAGFPRLGPSPRQEQTRLAPELPPDGSEGVGKGRVSLAVPSGRADGREDAVVEVRGEQGYEGEQPEQAGRRSGDRPVRPLAPRLDAEVIPRLAEGDFH